MRRMLVCFFLVSLSLLIDVTPISAWGATGHRIVAQIATRHISEKTARALKQLLGWESLPQTSTWPDEVRSDPKWDHAVPWHYISIDVGEDFKTMPRNPDGDIVESLRRLERVLRDPKASREDKVVALRFYVHLVGDIHQPLHVGRRNDRGGSDIKVKWFSEESNLHRVWDSGMIDKQRLSFSEFASFIDHPTLPQIRRWQAAEYEDWVEEMRNMREAIYTASNDFKTEQDRDLGYRYSYRHLPTVKEQMVKAGVRLAGMLNRVFDR